MPGLFIYKWGAMKMLICNIRHEKLEEVREKLFELGVPGLTISEVRGIGKPMSELRGQSTASPHRVPQFQPRMEVRIVLEDDAVEEVADTIMKICKTGNLGDGKLFVLPVEEAIRVRTGERGDQALY